MSFLRRFIQVLSQNFGRSFRHDSLRYAIFAFIDSGFFFPSSCSRFGDPVRKLKNYNKATEALRLRINNPDSINEGDLFASFFLSFTDFYGYPKNQEEQKRLFLTHLRGFLAIADHLCNGVGRKMTMRNLSMHWHFTREELKARSDHCWPFVFYDSLDGSTEFMQVFGLPTCRTFLPCFCALEMSLSSTNGLLLQEKLQFLSIFSLVQDLHRRNHEIWSDEAETLKLTLAEYRDDRRSISENTCRKLDEFKRILTILHTFPDQDEKVECMWVKAWILGQDLILPTITRFMAFLLQTEAKSLITAVSSQEGIELGTHVASRILYVGRVFSLCSGGCKHELQRPVSEENRQVSFTTAGRYYLESKQPYLCLLFWLTDSIWYIYSLGLDGETVDYIFRSLRDCGILKDFSDFGFDYPVNTPLRQRCGASHVIEVRSKESFAPKLADRVDKRGIWAWAVSAILEGQPLPLNFRDRLRRNFMIDVSGYFQHFGLQPPFPNLDIAHFDRMDVSIDCKSFDVRMSQPSWG
jgi:hypothetical protein